MNPSDNSSRVATWESPEVILLDACVLLNLCASGRIAAVPTAVARRSIVSAYVSREALWYLVPGDSAATTVGRRDVALGPLIAAHLIEVVELMPAETDIFIALAKDLGDGEAASRCQWPSAGLPPSLPTIARRARSLLAICRPS